MLREKDQQIEELTRMLRQKQRLVEVLRTQLEHVNRGGPEPPVLLRVKQEPPDGPDGPLSFGQPPLSFGQPPLSPSPSPVSSEVDVIQVDVKQEAVEAEDAARETTMHLADVRGLPRPLTQSREQLRLQIQPEPTSAQAKRQQVSHASFTQQSGSAHPFPLDLLKSNSGPTLVTDGKGNHFLVALTSHVPESHGTAAPGSRATNQIALQVRRSLSAILFNRSGSFRVPLNVSCVLHVQRGRITG
ncbi:MKL/myocardin-like protein 1 [Liparis tanakae]|uniref:MKL/myocardin-like protein 1 n=1 Tax=Liparis tanakae TaxID=230148 RepID=A0A4Z2E2Q0_9TELE|nr:MKL/myocardin-like protein 1 [Liparis tanakae]